MGGQPKVYNVTLTDADTEYSQAIDGHAGSISFQSRSADVRFAFETGKVATPTAPYATLFGGTGFEKVVGDLVGVTLFLATSVAGEVVEIIVWPR